MRKRRATSLFETPSAIISTLCARRTSAAIVDSRRQCAPARSTLPLCEAAMIDIAAVSRVERLQLLGARPPAPGFTAKGEDR